MTNPFSVLGISEYSSREQIQHAYRHLVKIWHPDIQTNEEDRIEAQERLVALNLAYEEALRRSDAAAKVRTAYHTYTLEDTNRLAAKLFSQKMFDSALRVLERCDDRNEAWYYLHGQVLSSLSRPADAYVSFRKCVQLSPNNNTYRMAALKSHTAMKKQQQPLGKAEQWVKGIFKR